MKKDKTIIVTVTVPVPETKSFVGGFRSKISHHSRFKKK